MEVTLPWPPRQLNPNFKRRHHWSRYSGHSRTYRQVCFALAKSAGLAGSPGEIPITIEFHPPDHRRRDRDNLLGSIKNGLDGIADAMGVNDRNFVPTIVRCEPVRDGKVVVRVG